MPTQPAMMSSLYVVFFGPRELPATWPGCTIVEAERARRKCWRCLFVDAESVRLAARDQLGRSKRFFQRHIVQVADLVVGAERRRKAGVLPLRLCGP